MICCCDWLARWCGSKKRETIQTIRVRPANKVERVRMNISCPPSLESSSTYSGQTICVLPPDKVEGLPVRDLPLDDRTIDQKITDWLKGVMNPQVPDSEVFGSSFLTVSTDTSTITTDSTSATDSTSSQIIKEEEINQEVSVSCFILLDQSDRSPGAALES